MNFVLSDPGAGDQETASAPVFHVSERARHREIASYLDAASFPSDVVLGPPTSPRMNQDCTLNALVQLGALKLDCDRSFLSLIDREYQFICAEATRSGSLTTDKAKPNDHIFLGLSKLEICWGLCPQTMQVFLDNTRKFDRRDDNVICCPEYYIINDFRTNLVHKEKPFVVGYPHMVSYLEVPLIAPSGYILGSYCVVDSKFRQFEDATMLATMNEIASAIMSHLETVKLKRFQDRSQRMINGLGEFIRQDSTASPPPSSSDSKTEVKSPTEEANDITHVPETERRSSSNISIHHSGQRSKDSDISTPPGIWNVTTPLSTPLSTPLQLTPQNPFDIYTAEKASPSEQLAPSSTAVSESNPSNSLVSEEVRRIFARAATTIQANLDLDGFMFLDAVPNEYGGLVHDVESPTTLASEQQGAFPNTAHLLENLGSTPEFKDVDSRTPSSVTDPGQDENLVQCEIIAQSLRSPKQEFGSPLPAMVMRGLIQKFPRGKIFSADEWGPIDVRYDPGGPYSGSNAILDEDDLEGDIAQLFNFLPNARYIVFVPLWHFKRECWFASAFGWVEDLTQNISISDINLLSAFGNSVMAEVLQFEALEISRAKSDFISSISHELRSPLHGILASSELIRDAMKDPLILPLLDMIDSCGTTLLDTFNNLLDHAKIDNVASLAVSRASKDHHETTQTDLSQLLEEIADSVHLSHTSKTAFQSTLPAGGMFATVTDTAQAEQDRPDQSVLVTVDIEQGPNWELPIDVGAWKRIISNLLSNALKYTRQGHIQLYLRLVTPTDPRVPTSNQLCLTVKDTGIGISLDYLKYHLYTPFAQENTLAPGTGLGLSIVRKIVNGLNGTMSIQSKIGVGTQVQVVIPIDMAITMQLSPLPQIYECQAAEDDATMKQSTICYVTPEAYATFDPIQCAVTTEAQERSRLLERALRPIIEGRFGAELVFATEDGQIPVADAYFFDSHTLGRASKGNLNSLIHPRLLELSPLVVLCSDIGSLHRWQKEEFKYDVVLLRLPITPNKISSVLTKALDLANDRTLRCDLVLNATSPEHNNFPATSPPILNKPLNPAIDYYTSRQNTDAFGGYLQARSLSSTLLDPPSPAPPVPPKQHLLLVDDNPINLKILTAVVNKLGHAYIAATNGRESIQAYEAAHHQQKRFDVVFMDISMPILSGFEASRGIREFERKHKIPPTFIVALTGLGDDRSRQQAHRSGMNLFLMKPLKLALIKKVIDERDTGGNNRLDNWNGDMMAVSP